MRLCAPASVYDANRFMLHAMLQRLGVVVHDLGILPDDRDATATALSAAAENHDLVVTSGGVSMGEEDHVKAALEAKGSLAFWKLAIKPGRPVAMGILHGTPFVGLPGNPVAVFVCFAALVRPLLAALNGATGRALAPAKGDLRLRLQEKAGTPRISPRLAANRCVGRNDRRKICSARQRRADVADPHARPRRTA